MKVALINMPFGSLYRPTIGLSLLKAGLKQNNIESDIHYLNLRFAELISTELYNHIAEGTIFSSNALAGEMVFSQYLFKKDTFESYVEEALNELSNTREDFNYILKARTYVEQFIELCLSEIDWNNYSVVGFTSVFEQNVACLCLAKRIKEKYPHIFIMFGGANCEETMGRELIRQFKFIDAVCSGEGDHTFVEFITAMSKTKNEIPSVEGIFLQRDLKIPVSKKPIPQKIVNVDELPYPDYSDYFEQFMNCNFKDEINQTRFLFESSRGCWWGQKHHCVFCGLNGSNMNFRSKSAERAMDELLYLHNQYKEYTTKAAAVDNIIDMDYFKNLLPTLKEQNLDLDMFYETKANLKKSQIELFRDANFRTIQPGIESLITSVLKQMNKGITMLQNIQLLKWTKEYNVNPVWNILYGFPDEDPEEYYKLPDLLRKIPHLTPPGNMAKIRLDRFSPYFNESEKSGLTNVRAMWPYKYIYSGLEQASLDRLAYHFDYDYLVERNPFEYTSEVRRAVLDWIKVHRRSDLFFVDNNKELVIVDMRIEDEYSMTVLAEEKRQVYLAMDSVTNLTSVVKKVSNEGYAIDSEVCKTIIDDLIDKNLVLEENGRFISIALNCKIYSPSKTSLTMLSNWSNQRKLKDAVLS